MLKTLQAAGCRIPEDLALVGFDDLAEAQSTTPPLTTVRQSYPALGQHRRRAAAGPARRAGRPARPDLCADRADRPALVWLRQQPGRLGVRARTMCPAAPGWQDALAQQLVRLALHPLPLDPATPPAQVWPGVEVLLQGLEAAIQGTAGAPARPSWRAPGSRPSRSRRTWRLSMRCSNGWSGPALSGVTAAAGQLLPRGRAWSRFSIRPPGAGARPPDPRDGPCQHARGTGANELCDQHGVARAGGRLGRAPGAGCARRRCPGAAWGCGASPAGRAGDIGRRRRLPP